MKKHTVLNCLLIIVGCSIFLLGGCDEGAKGPPQPTVVRKKISTLGATDAGAPAESTVQTPRPAKPIQAKVEPQTQEKNGPAKSAAPQSPPAATAQPVSSQPAGPADGDQSKALLAQTAPQSANQPLSPPQPKSDISPLAPQSGDGGQPPPAAVKEEKEAVLVASTDGGSEPLYNPAGKIDPFEPLFKEKAEETAAKKTQRKRRAPQTPLERIDLGQLKLVAIITAASGNRALVEESSGKGYVIKRGTYIGMNAGRVADIQNDKVLVEEEYEDVFGKLKVQTKELKLPKPPGEL